MKYKIQCICNCKFCVTLSTCDRIHGLQPLISVRMLVEFKNLNTSCYHTFASCHVKILGTVQIVEKF